jgi:hypothetical protein
MRRAGLVLLSGLIGSSAVAADRLEAFLARNPVTEAEKAFAAGERRQIVLPVCGEQRGEVIPGWSQEEVIQSNGLPTPAVEKAMNEGQRPLSCADFADDKKNAKFIRAAKYAEQYNRKLRELERLKK